LSISPKIDPWEGSGVNGKGVTYLEEIISKVGQLSPCRDVRLSEIQLSGEKNKKEVVSAQLHSKGCET
jgi:hypothetical protein